MKDLTLLYYTASTIEDLLGENVRKHLLGVNKNTYPIISVSQKPLDFGTNINVGKLGQSYYNCYKQIYIGSLAVKTKYVAMCEDDTLYSMEHFSHRPPLDNIFSYNQNMWYAEETEFWTKGWNGMCTCIVSTEYLREILTKRFLKYPSEKNISKRAFQEPGKWDNANAEYWSSKTPILTFNYFRALGGKAKSVAHPPISKQDLEPWGNCWELKKKFWGRARPRNECPPKYASN